MEIKNSKISTKGQLTIPKEFRDKLNLHSEDEVILYIKDDRMIVKPKVAHLGMLRGLLRKEIDIDKAHEFIQSERKKWST